MKHNLLVQLDCILDTRLAVLGSYDPTIAERILADEENFKKYRTRLIDDFSEYGLSREEFKKLYKERNINHLRSSVITPFGFEMVDIVEQIIDQSRAAPHTISDFDVIINYHPYVEMSQDEKDAIQGAILARFRHPVDIKFICEPIEALSPIYWEHQKIATSIMYDFDEWLVAHFGVGNEDILRSFEMSQNSVYAPALVTDLAKLKEAANYENPQGRKADPLESIQFWMKPYFHLEFIGVEHFSIIEPTLFTSMETRTIEYINN